MIELAVQQLQKYYGAVLVLDQTSFEVQQGSRTGVIGPNGCGKTTLFKILAGLEPPDGGSLHIRRGATLGYLPQTPDYGEKSVQEVLWEPFAEIISWQRRLQQLEKDMANAETERLQRMLAEYAKLQDSFERTGGYSLQEQLDRIQQGLKIPTSFLQRSFASLSGGEQSRVGLAKTLLEKPDILLLDEPTNHLDLDSLTWLEGFLREYKGTVLIISHDRYFLDATVNGIVEMESGRAQRWIGNYSLYQSQKLEKLQQQLELFENQQKKVAAMEATIKKLRLWGQQGDNAKFFKRAASMEKRLDKMDKVDKPALEVESIDLRLSSAGRSGRDTLQLDNVHFGYDEPLLRGAKFLLRRGERVALVGENGSGKTTLIRLLQAEMQPEQGTIRWGASTKIGWLDQVVRFRDESHTILDCFRDTCPMAEGPARSILAKFLFRAEDVFKTVGTLSGGERSRLRLCQLMHGEYNVLVMDEPTNHLDIPAMETLEETLQEFAGTLFMVSHDRYFINKTADMVLELRSGRLYRHWGDFDSYWQQRLLRQEQEKQQKLVVPKAPKPSKPPRSSNNGQKQRVDSLEKEITQLETILGGLKVRMHEVGNNAARALELFEQQQEVQGQLDQALEEWLKCNDN